MEAIHQGSLRIDIAEDFIHIPVLDDGIGAQN